jgi:hypothetical protein
MTPIFCSGCGELLFEYNEENQGNNYLGNVLHACSPTTSAITKIEKWFGSEMKP